MPKVAPTGAEAPRAVRREGDVMGGDDSKGGRTTRRSNGSLGRRSRADTDAGEAASSVRELFADDEGAGSSILNALNDSVYVLDCAGRFVFVNRAAREKSKVSLERWRQLRCTDVVAPESRDEAAENFRRIVSGEPVSPPPRTLDYFTGDGTRRTVEVNSAPILRGGRIIGVIGVSRDVTRRKRADAELEQYRRRIEELVDARPAKLREIHALLREQVRQREQAEAALRASEHQYRTLVENLHVGLYRTSPDGLILHANPALVSMLGYDSVEELRSRGVLASYAAPDERARLLEDLSRTGAVRERELRLRRKDGTCIWAAVSARLHREPQGGDEWIDGMIEDITRRKADERRLHELSQFLQSVIDNANVWLNVLDDSADVVLWNKAAEQISGYTRQEVLHNDRIWRWLYPDSKYRDEILRRVRAVINGGEPTGDTEALIRCKDGGRRWVAWSSRPLLDEHGRPCGLIALARDVTQRKRAEQELQESRERLRHIIDNTSDIIFQIDTAGNYTFGNQAAESVTGYTLEELIGMNMSRLVAPEYRQALFDRLARRLRGQPLVQPFQFEIARKDGRRVSLEMTTSPIYRRGDLVGIQGIARDVTERERAERALRRHREQLRAAHAKLVTARDEERRSVAAELHDSVGQSVVAMELAIRNLADEVAGVDGLPSRIGALADQCAEVVREVRHICHGLYPPVLESLGLATALRQLVRHCANGGIRVHLQSDPDLGERRLDRQVEVALYRVAQEAVNNALRHSGAEHVGIEFRADDDVVALKVTDDGCGFDPQQALNGMGLVSMTERVEALGGTLEVRSEPGRTEIVARVPAQPA
ncbi:MAG: PAS domain-containing sensor histidine kinase [Planctomycetota bacterium]